MTKNNHKIDKKEYGTRVKSSLFSATDLHWSTVIADELIKVFPNEEIYTSAAGISPSGVVHFGNFRDVMTAFAVSEGLKNKGKKTRLIFSWDDFDRFRKVPLGVDESFVKYIGMPLTSVPDPIGEMSSYAKRFETEFENAIKDLDIELEFRYQTNEYKSGKYDDLIIKAMQNRLEIADILLSFMTDIGKEEKKINPEEYRNKYYPISVYSRFNGKDNTEIIDYDGQSTITYRCLDTGEQETVDFTKEHIVKLSWKSDWPMRWFYEGVVFEPGGKDHASPGGSYDTSSLIAERIFGKIPPVFAGYEFIGIQGLGAKMSGSKGNAVTPTRLLEIYEPELLKWLYLRRLPNQAFQLTFDTEIYRQYDEFDREVVKNKEGELDDASKMALELSCSGHKNILEIENPIPFKQAVALGQIMQWNSEKLIEFLNDLNLSYSNKSIKSRLVHAKSWLETYNPSEMIVLRDDINFDYSKNMTEGAKKNIQLFREKLKDKGNSIIDLEKIMYDIPKDSNLTPKENNPLQRAFFKDIYNLLISSDAGPRLSTFLWAIDREKILGLLNI